MSDTTSTTGRRFTINKEKIKKVGLGLAMVIVALVLAVEVGWQLKDTTLLQPLAQRLASGGNTAAVATDSVATAPKVAQASSATPATAQAATIPQSQLLSPVVLDARKCGIKDYYIDEINGTLTVKPDATCARLVTLADLEREKAAGQ